MKKRPLFAALLSAALLLGLAGCGGEAQTVEPAVTVEGTEISGETAVADVLALLGGEYEYYEAISCVYDGMDKTYTYGDCVLYTFPDGDTDRLMELYCTGGDVSAQGITFGSSRDAVVETFGDGYVEEGSLLSYETAPASANNTPASLYFELTDGAVTAIGITAEHRSQ